MKAISFAGKEYNDQTALVRSLARNWADGKMYLFHGMLSNFYRRENPEAAAICDNAVSESLKSRNMDDVIFWRTLYALAPDINDFFWKGHVYIDTASLGLDMLKYLRADNNGMDKFLDSLFQESILSQYILLKQPEEKRKLDDIRSLEASYRACTADQHERTVILYQTAYMLSGQRILCVGHKNFHTLDDLTSYMMELLGEHCENLEGFRDFCHELIGADYMLMPSLEAWLIVHGRSAELKSWKDSLELKM